MLPTQYPLELATNPFERQRVMVYAQEGETISEMLACQGILREGPYGIAVTLNGETVPDHMLHHVRPKAGSNLVASVVPRGDDAGKTIFMIVFAVLLIATAVFAPGGLVALIGSGGLISPAGAAAAGALLGGVMGIVSGIQSLLAPPPQVPFSGPIPQSGDSAALTGTSNTARLYGPIRTLLGEYRVYPDLLGKPFAEKIGKDSVLRMLLCFGYGPMNITDIRIGDRPIDELIDPSKYVVHQGWDDDPELTIFRDEVDTDTSFTHQFPIKRDEDGIVEEDWSSVPDISAIMSTEQGPEEISIDIGFQNGLIAFHDDGAPANVSVFFRIEEQELDDGDTWTPIGTPTMGLDEDTGVTLVSPGLFKFKLAERGGLSRGLRWTVPGDSTLNVVHRVRLTRVDSMVGEIYTQPSGGITDFEHKVISDAFCNTIRTIKPHVAAQIPNLAKIELEINASETGLAGVINDLSANCVSIAPVYDTVSKIWGPTHAKADQYGVSMFETRNPAWLFAQVLRGPANSKPIPASRIDGPGLDVWAGNLNGTGSEPISGTDGLRRDMGGLVDTSTTARKVLADIAGCGRGALNIVDGKYSVVQDIPRENIIQHFSPRNSSGFSGAKAFTKKIHGVKTHFVNPDLSYQRDEMLVYNDGYSLDGNRYWALNPEGTPTGINTSRATAVLTESFTRVTVDDDTGEGPWHSIADGYIDNFQGSDYPYVRMKLRRGNMHGRGWTGLMQWATVEDGSFWGSQQITIPEPYWNEGDWTEIVWDMRKVEEWYTREVIRPAFRLWYESDAEIDDYYDILELSIDDNTLPATEFTELSLWGINDPDQVYRDARYHMASAQLRPEIFTITADVEHIVCNRGDRVKVSHDVIGVGYGGARLTAVTNSEGDFVSATMDEEFFYDSTKDYACRIRQSDGNDLLVNLANLGETSSDLIADPAIAYSGLAPAVGDALLFGERDTESLDCVVFRISPRNDLAAQISLVEYNEDIYNTGYIPDHEANITLENMPTLLRPVAPILVGDPVTDESVLSFAASGVTMIQILLNITTPQNATGSYSPTTHYHAQFRMKQDGVAVTSWINVPTIEASAGETRMFISPVEERETYDVRFRAISEVSSTSSDWVRSNDIYVTGTSTPPDPPTLISVWGDAIRWEYGERPNDFAGFIVKHQKGDDATWSTGIKLTDAIITDNWVQIGGRIQPGPTTLMVRAVDISGNESTTLSAIKTIRGVDDRFVIQTDTHTSVWSGTKTNCTIDTSAPYVLEADGATGDLFWTGEGSLTFWSSDTSVDFWDSIDYQEMTYLFSHLMSDDYFVSAPPSFAWPLADQLPGRVRFRNFEIEGSEYRIEYRAVKNAVTAEYYTDWLPWPGVRDLEEREFPELYFGIYEYTEIRIVISGGSVQGKLKEISMVIEGTPRTHSVIQEISSSGSLISLDGLEWRKITGITVTPANEADSSQGALTSEAYNLLDYDSATEPWELVGPTVIVRDADGDPATINCSVVIEGY